MTYTDSNPTGVELGHMTCWALTETPLLHRDPLATIARRSGQRRARLLAKIDVAVRVTVLDADLAEAYDADSSDDVAELDEKFGPPTSLVETESNVAVSAVNDLILWLGQTVEGVAELIGVSRRQIFNWRSNPDVDPRPASTERLYEIHGALMPLAMAVGRDRMLSEVRSGAPSLADLLDAGDLRAAAALAEERADAAFAARADRPINPTQLASANERARQQLDQIVAGGTPEAGGDRALVTPPLE